MAELKKLGYEDKKQAEEKYKKIQLELKNYIKQNVPYHCNVTYGTSKRICKSNYNKEQSTYRQKYIKEKLNEKEQKLIKLYDSYYNASNITKYSLIGYIIIPATIFMFS